MPSVGHIESTWLRFYIVCMLLIILVMMMYEINVNSFNRVVWLLVICEVMGIHIYIALEDFYEDGLIMYWWNKL